MIKGRMGNVVLIGLSRMNTERLLKDMPIKFDGADVALPGLTFVIIGGESEPELMAQLQKAGLIDAETKIDDRFTGKGNH
jgi:hypothetical protein